MKYFKRILKILCVVSAILTIETVCQFVFVPIGYAHCIRLKTDDQNRDVQTLFLGASHTLSLDTDVLEANAEKIGTSEVHAGGANQMGTIYYQLLDYLSRHSVKTVYLDVTPSIFSRYEDVDILYTIGNINSITSPVIRLRADAACLSPRDWGNKIFFGKYCLSLNNTPESIPQNIRAKLNTFLGKTDNTEKRVIRQKEDFDYDEKLAEYQKEKAVFTLSEKETAYLHKFIQLCMKRDIEPVLYSVICPAAFVYGHENYDETHTLFQEIAQEYGLQYYDFNYYIGRAELFDEYDHFYDSNHLNNEGGTIFTNLLSDWILEGKPDRFYADAQEMLATYPFP